MPPRFYLLGLCFGTAQIPVSASPTIVKYCQESSSRVNLLQFLMGTSTKAKT